MEKKDGQPKQNKSVIQSKTDKVIDYQMYHGLLSCGKKIERNHWQKLIGLSQRRADLELVYALVLASEIAEPRERLNASNLSLVSTSGIYRFKKLLEMTVRELGSSESLP